MAGRLFGWLDVDEREGAALMRAHPEAWTSPGTAFDYYAAHPEGIRRLPGALSLRAVPRRCRRNRQRVRGAPHRLCHETIY